MAVLLRASFCSFLFLTCSLLLASPLCRTSHAQSAAMTEAMGCSMSGNYTLGDAYATNLDRFLTALPEYTVSKHGGFFIGRFGKNDSVYGLAMCSADYSRADCSDCLAATAGSNTSGGLPNRCPGSKTVIAVFDKCLVRYSNHNFLGTARTDIIYVRGAPSSALAYSSKVADRLQLLTGEAAASRQRFAVSSMDDVPPYVLMQCTWDLTADKCKQCLGVLLANASDWFSSTGQGKRKTYSCAVRYSNTSFMVLPFSNSAPDPSGSLLPPSNGDGAPAPSGSLLPPTSLVPASTSRRGSRTVVMVVISVIASIVVAALLGALLWRVYRSRCLPTKTQVMGNVEPTEQIFQTLTTVKTQEFVPRSFTYEELAVATSDFAAGKKLGEGSFGVVYEGTVPGIGGTVEVTNVLEPDQDTINSLELLHFF